MYLGENIQTRYPTVDNIIELINAKGRLYVVQTGYEEGIPANKGRPRGHTSAQLQVGWDDLRGHSVGDGFEIYGCRMHLTYRSFHV